MNPALSVEFNLWPAKEGGSFFSPLSLSHSLCLSDTIWPLLSTGEIKSIKYYTLRHKFTSSENLNEIDR